MERDAQWHTIIWYLYHTDAVDVNKLEGIDNSKK